VTPFSDPVTFISHDTVYTITVVFCIPTYHISRTHSTMHTTHTQCPTSRHHPYTSHMSSVLLSADWNQMQLNMCVFTCEHVFVCDIHAEYMCIINLIFHRYTPTHTTQIILCYKWIHTTHSHTHIPYHTNNSHTHTHIHISHIILTTHTHTAFIEEDAQPLRETTTKEKATETADESNTRHPDQHW